jgi:hypothetical protein
VLLPNTHLAEIDPQKLHGYLLSKTHPVGRFKARFFAALGYAAERWQEFEAALRIQHLTEEVQPGESLAEGQVFTIRAILKGPNGQSAVVLSVWFVDAAGGAPRFVPPIPEASSDRSTSRCPRPDS